MLILTKPKRKQREGKKEKFSYRWREVSTSELSKLFDGLTKFGSTGHKLDDRGVIFLMGRESAHLTFWFELGPRERKSWLTGCLYGRMVSGWPDNSLPESKSMAGAILSDSEKSFSSSFSSRLSFTLCNCLNLSWRRAMEELTMVGSLPCLPIWELNHGEYWWELRGSCIYIGEDRVSAKH